MREVDAIPSYIASQSESWSDYITNLAEWIVVTQLTERQKTRLYGFATYKDITHELYYHLGMYFKKRMLFLKGMARKALLMIEYQKERAKLRGYTTFSVVLSDEEQDESLTRLQELEDKLRGYAPLVQLEDGDTDIRNYNTYLKALEDYHRVWRMIRGRSEQALEFRKGVVDLAKRIQYGNFYPEQLDLPEDEVVTKFMQGKGEFDHDFDSNGW